MDINWWKKKMDIFNIPNLKEWVKFQLALVSDFVNLLN